MYKTFYYKLAKIFFTIFILFMITFQSRQNIIKSADIIERKAHSVYPHTSSSGLKIRCRHAYNISELSSKKMPDFYQNISKKIKETRNILKHSKTVFYDLITGMQDKKVGNCFEEALLALLIGKINGQKNIYLGEIFIEKENTENKRKVDHAVAFITNKKFKSGDYLNFRKKDAVIIDPWLGISDFAENYFLKLKNDFGNLFSEIPNQDFLLYLIGTESKNIKEFREGRKNSCQEISFSIKPAKTIFLGSKKKSLYKSFFPELAIKKYKKIDLDKK